jgi:hypothetical protein
MTDPGGKGVNDWHRGLLVRETQAKALTMGRSAYSYPGERLTSQKQADLPQ